MSAVLRIVPTSSYSLDLDTYGFPMRCVFDWDAGEPGIFWPTERAHPGSPPNAELLEVWVGEHNIIEALSSDRRLRIEEALIASMEQA
jgi:hypothetical protein